MRRARGFTLIEILVVVVILTVVVGMVGLNPFGDESRAVREESQRLALLIKAAREEAILEGRVLGVGLKEDGYAFLTLNEKAELVPLEGDDLLRPRALPAAMTLEVETLAGGIDAKLPVILLLPTGELERFVLRLKQGEVVYRVEGSGNGRIQSVAPNV